MSETTGHSSEGKYKKGNRRVCATAYTLNNSQPVNSTIIGDQPLFYMDFDCGYDEEFIDDIESGPLEEEIAALEKEIQALENFSASYEDDGRKLFDDLIDNGQDITAPKDSSDGNQSFLVSRLKKVLGDSRLGAAYLESAQTYGVNLEASTNVEYSLYDRRAGKIFINPGHTFPAQVLLAVKELRMHWQHRNGALINPLVFHPDSAVLVNRLQMADLAVSIIRIAWELQLSGHKDLWERIELSPIADLGRAFAREAFLDFRTINNGMASAAVVESWFLSERCQAHDRALVRKMLVDHEGYVFDLESVSKGITPNLIAALGTMPFGKNYLAQHADTIMNDPIFTEVRDRSNANFLWFIKFERSFRETEQGLQIHPDNNKGSQSLGASSNQKQRDGYHEQTAQVVRLEPKTGFNGRQNQDAEEQENNREESKKILSAENNQHKDGAGSDNIVYLGRWSAE